jgi:cytochrome P450
VKGYLTQFSRDPTGFLLRCAETNGPISTIKPSLTLLSDPADIAYVLQHTGSTFSRTHNFLGQPVSETDVKEWEVGRRTVFTELRVAVERIALDAISQAFEQLIASWPDRPVSNGISRFETATSSVIGRICFVADGDRIVGFAGQLLEVLFEVAEMQFNPPRWAPIRLRAQQCEHRLRKEVRSVVDARMSQVSDMDLAGLLTHPEIGSLGADLSTRMLISVMLAGYGVPAVALAWTVLLLDKYPAERQRIADEVRSVSD